VDRDLFSTGKNILVLEIERRRSDQLKAMLGKKRQKTPTCSGVAAEGCDEDRGVENKAHGSRVSQMAALEPHPSAMKLRMDGAPGTEDDDDRGDGVDRGHPANPHLEKTEMWGTVLEDDEDA
jgi:hypothetical protein